MSVLRSDRHEKLLGAKTVKPTVDWVERAKKSSLLLEDLLLFVVKPADNNV
jgi:hypothetical protein